MHTHTHVRAHTHTHTNGSVISREKVKYERYAQYSMYIVVFGVDFIGKRVLKLKKIAA